VTAGRLSAGAGVTGRVVASAVACALALLPGCARTVVGEASAGSGAPTPAAPEQLEPLIVGEVPAGLPRLPDDSLSPPAGAKGVPDVAAYARDPDHEREVLAGYGFRFGWERFWGTDGSSGPVTSVFVYQFEDRAGASAYAHDLAGNDAEHYRGVLREDPPGLPGGCRLMTVQRPDADLPGPAASAWCGHGVFSVSVTAVMDSTSAATEEVAAVLRAQLDRLPPS
jgi:hypothetical protein